jgi:hypothetical protein
MFSRKIGLVFGLLLLVSVVARGAEPLPGMYTVNYKMLFLFHPLMADFDLQLGRHLRKDVKLEDQKVMQNVQAQMTALNKGAMKAIAELQRKIELLQVDLDNLDYRKKGLVESRLADTAGKKAGARPLPPSLKKLEAGLAVASEPWKVVQAAKDELQKEIDALRKAQSEAYDSVYDPMYLSRSESEARVGRAIREIDGLLENYSRQHGNAVIVDADFVTTATPPQEFRSTLENCSNYLTIGLRQKLLDFDLTLREEIPPLYAQSSESRDMYVQAMVQPKKLDEMVSRTVSKMPWVQAALATRGRLLLVGGDQADITVEILRGLFAAHKVKDDVAKRILELVPEYGK